MRYTVAHSQNILQIYSQNITSLIFFNESSKEKTPSPPPKKKNFWPSLFLRTNPTISQFLWHPVHTSIFLSSHHIIIMIYVSSSRIVAIFIIIIFLTFAVQRSAWNWTQAHKSLGNEKQQRASTSASLFWTSTIAPVTFKLSSGSCTLRWTEQNKV